MAGPGNLLGQILENKRREVERRQREQPLLDLKRRVAELPVPLNFAGALWGDRIRLIAEVKKASPSRGVLAAQFDPVGLAQVYAQNGAAAVSVLTDEKYFQGSLEHLKAVKQALGGTIPVLRKDFIVDAYQVYESRVAGADAVLLIVAALRPAILRELLALSRSLWLQCLVEVHTEEEVALALECGAEVIGINNRDLRTFMTDLAVTQRLAPHIPQGRLIVSESGISSQEDMLRLQRMGVHAALVGEALVTAGDVGAKVRELAGSS